MGREISVESSLGSYRVTISSEISQFLSPNDVGIVDRSVSAQYRLNQAGLMNIEAVEENKSLETVKAMLLHLDSEGANRSSRVVAIGGGFIQDIATMGCSLYMRGVDWIFFPTTLMAMLDSCVGGKSSINLGTSKNKLGNFFPPREVHIDLSFVETLSEVEIISGLAEGVKISFARGASAFNRFIENSASRTVTPGGNLEDLIYDVLRAKVSFIEEDEFDRGSRQLLNFGHTFGHAFETATSFRLQHGVCVGVGMLAAIRHSAVQLNTHLVQLEEYVRNLLNPLSDQLGKVTETTDWGLFGAALAQDKKHTRDKFTFVLPSSSGELVLRQFSRGPFEIERAVSSIQEAIASLVD